MTNHYCDRCGKKIERIEDLFCVVGGPCIPPFEATQTELCRRCWEDEVKPVLESKTERETKVKEFRPRGTTGDPLSDVVRII